LKLPIIESLVMRNQGAWTFKTMTGIEDHLSAEGFGLLDVWMSHGDRVVELPEGFVLIASSDGAPIAGIANEEQAFYALQFHPEVTHTKQGGRILSRFVLDICGCEALWIASNIIEDSINAVRERVGSDHVILGLSGGVDSSVVAALLHKAIEDQLTCVFVDTGLLRLHEGDQVMAIFAEHLGVKVIRVDAEQRYLEALNGVSDPEQNAKLSATCLWIFLMKRRRKLPMQNGWHKARFIRM